MLTANCCHRIAEEKQLQQGSTSTPCLRSLKLLLRVLGARPPRQLLGIHLQLLRACLRPSLSFSGARSRCSLVMCSCIAAAALA